MKPRLLLISAVTYFLLVNSMGLIDYLPLQGWSILLTLFLLLMYIFFAVALLVAVVKMIREKFTNKSRNISVGIVSLVLVLIFCFPNGMIDWNRVEGKDTLVGYREGVANCMITFRLKEDHVFTIKEVCFDVAKTKGYYKQVNDSTIRLIHTSPATYLNHYTFAIIKRGQHKSGEYMVIKLYNDERNDYLQDFVIDGKYESFSLK